MVMTQSLLLLFFLEMSQHTLHDDASCASSLLPLKALFMLGVLLIIITYYLGLTLLFSEITKQHYNSQKCVGTTC